jgi:hypothetical protein
MKLRSIGCALCASVFFVTVFQAGAQEAPALPKVLRIFREEVKQGRGAAHEKTEASFVKMFTKYKYPVYSIGCDVLAGPTEAWFFEAHDSFKSIQNAETMIEKNAAIKADFASLDSMDGELRTNSTTMIAVLRDELSYHASQFAQDLPKARYFSMSINRIRPSTGPRLTELVKELIAANEKAMIEVPFSTYQVVAGGPGGGVMYLVFRPMKSLETMDGNPERGKALRTAMGSDQYAAYTKGIGEIETESQSLLLAINPKMSYVSKDMAAQDPDFWTPKPAIGSAKPAAPKQAEKPPAGQ